MSERRNPIAVTEPLSEPRDPAQDAANARRLVSALQRYAGWLDKDRASVAVRADVDALASAVETGANTLPYLQAVDRGLGRLIGGGVRKMLLSTFREIRTALDPAAIDTDDTERL